MLSPKIIQTLSSPIKFSPIIIGAIGYFFLNAQNMGSSSNDDPALDRFRDQPKKRKKK